MTFSQNLQFDGQVPQEQEFEPAGEPVARLLQSAIRDSGWEVDELDNWRDCGWSVDCRRADAQLQVAITEIAPSEWMLQVAPLHVPGLFGRLRGRQPSASRGDALDLARLIHAALVADERFSRFRWLWDGFPDDGESTPGPVSWDNAS